MQVYVWRKMDAVKTEAFDLDQCTIDGKLFFQVRPKAYSPQLARPLYNLDGCIWDKSKRVWVIPRNAESTSFMTKWFGSIRVSELDHSVSSKDHKSNTYVNHSKKEKEGTTSSPLAVRRGKNYEQLSVAATNELLAVEEQMRLMRYSWSTIKSYLSHLRQFFRDSSALSPNEVTEDTIRRVLVELVLGRQVSSSTQIQFLSAIRFWWEQVKGRPKLDMQLQPRKEKKLPNVLSQEEVMRLFQAVDNLKHRCILMMIYSGGLRLSEACRLRVMDIHIDRNEIFIHAAKGKKDRFTTLSDRMLVQLKLYLEEYKPDYWLFEGQTGGAYSTRSVQAILRRAVKKSGVNPMATVHTLRHSYATHLLEQGVSLRHIQELLGHNSSKTTEIYTRVSNAERRKISSPLDRL